MRNIVVRSVRSFEYTVKAANITTSTVEEIKVNTGTVLKRPEIQLKRYMPDGYVFMMQVGDPVSKCDKRYMTTEDFMAHSLPYTGNDTDED